MSASVARRFALVGLGTLLAGGPALAETPVSDDALISADPQQVRAVLADYDQVAAMNADVLDYRVESAPPCQLVHITTRGLAEPMQYTVRRCPTETGWRETLVSGDGSMEAVEVEWRVEPDGEHTRVRLSVLARVARVPQFLVDQQTRRNVARTLSNLARKLDPTRR